jgi:hypothetical protein
VWPSSRWGRRCGLGGGLVLLWLKLRFADVARRLLGQAGIVLVPSAVRRPAARPAQAGSSAVLPATRRVVGDQTGEDDDHERDPEGSVHARFSPANPGAAAAQPAPCTSSLTRACGPPARRVTCRKGPEPGLVNDVVLVRRLIVLHARLVLDRVAGGWRSCHGHPAFGSFLSMSPPLGAADPLLIARLIDKCIRLSYTLQDTPGMWPVPHTQRTYFREER